MYKIKQSVLAAEFSCLADKCPSTCCAGWSVMWTDEEIKRLKSSVRGELAEKCAAAFQQINRYTSVTMNEEGFCPFLCDGLCTVHRDMGEELLSYTCREYPRLTIFDGKDFLRSCRSACYAVTERLISDDDCMRIVITDAEKDDIAAVIAEEKNHQYEALEKLLWDDDITITEALMKGTELYDIRSGGSICELNEAFESIYGWRLILPQEKITEFADTLRYCCKNAVRNIVRSLYLEWRIKGRADGISSADDYCSFVFRAAAAIKATSGACSLVGTKEELICTISDITGALFSERRSSVGVVSCMKENGWDNRDFLSYILK